MRCVVKNKLQELLAQRLVLRGEQSVAADEGRGFVQLHGKHQAGFEGGFIGPELCTPSAASGFNAQGVQRVITGVAQAKIGARFLQGQINVARHLDGHIELKTWAAHVAHARRAYAGKGQVDLCGVRKHQRLG